MGSKSDSPERPLWAADVPIVLKRDLILGIADIERAFPSVFFVCSALASIHTFKGFLQRVLEFLVASVVGESSSQRSEEA